MILINDVSVQSINVALLDLDRRLAILEKGSGDVTLIKESTKEEINSAIISLSDRVTNIVN